MFDTLGDLAYVGAGILVGASLYIAHKHAKIAGRLREELREIRGQGDLIETMRAMQGGELFMDPVNDAFSMDIEVANPLLGHPDYPLMNRALRLVGPRAVPDNKRNLELALMVAWLIQNLNPETKAYVLRDLDDV